MTILVLDIGSSSLKAALYSIGGVLLDRADATYAKAMSDHRQNPDDWWQAVIAAIGKMSEKPTSAVVLTGTMENLIPVDLHARPTMNAILYSDPVGEPFFAQHAEELERRNAIATLGNAPEPLMTAFKAMALRATDPDAFANARYFLPGAKDAIVYRLTGRAVTDPVTATTTGLMDFERRDWSSDLLAFFGLSRDQLPEIMPADAIVGYLEQRAATEIGLATGLPVINGCGDAGATTLGSGARSNGDTSLHLGTTGWVARVLEESPGQRSGNFYRLAHPISKQTIAIAPILSAGAAIRWAHTALNLDPARAEALALEADSDPSDVVFLPYLSGERSPFLDLDVRAGFVGISANAGPGDLYRSVLEGVGLAISANLDLLGHGTGEVSLVGGGALSPLWSQIIADLLGRPLNVPADPVAATALGGWQIGCAALGIDAIGQQAPHIVEPRTDRLNRSERLKKIFDAATRHARSLASADRKLEQPEP